MGSAPSKSVPVGLKRRLQDRDDTGLVNRAQSAFETPPALGHVIGHRFEVFVRHTHVAQAARDADGGKKLCRLVDCLIGNARRVAVGIQSPDLDAVLHEARQGLFRETVAHPVRGDDRKTHAVRDVVESRDFVLDAVAGPGRRRAS